MAIPFKNMTTSYNITPSNTIWIQNLAGVDPLGQNPWLSLEKGAWTWPWKISNVLDCFGALLEESVADSDNCQGFYHGGRCSKGSSMLSMPELVWKFNNVQHLQAEMVSIVCGLYTTQCVDRWRTTMWKNPQAARYYRLFACIHTITQLWGFRYLDTLSKSP